MRRTGGLAIAAVLAAFAAGASAQDAQEDEIPGGRVEAEVAKTQQEIEQHTRTMETILKEVQAIATSGKTMPEAIDLLQKQYQEASSATRDPEVKAELEAAVSILRSSETRKALQTMAQKPLNAKIPQWAFDLAGRANDASQAGSDDLAVQTMNDAWERQTRTLPPVTRREGTNFFSRSRWRISEEIEQRLMDFHPRAQEAPSLADQARQCGREVAQCRARLKAEEKELAELRRRASELAPRAGGTGSPEAIEARIQQLRAQHAGLKQRIDAAAGRVKTLYDSVERYNSMIREKNKECEANKDAFYEKYKADCVILRRWVENGRDWFEWKYAPADAWIAARDRDRKSWDEANQEHQRLLGEMRQAAGSIDQQTRQLEGARARQELERVRGSIRERSSSIEDLKRREAAASTMLANAMARLKALAAQFRQWVGYAKEALEGLRR